MAKTVQNSGISKPVVWGTRGLHPGFPWFRHFRVFRESSTQLLVWSCLSCLLRFRRFHDSVASIMEQKPIEKNHIKEFGGRNAREASQG